MKTRTRRKGLGDVSYTNRDTAYFVSNFVVGYPSDSLASC